MWKPSQLVHGMRSKVVPQARSVMTESTPPCLVEHAFDDPVYGSRSTPCF